MESYLPAAGPWRALHPREAPQLLSTVTSPWWIAGGWALDLFVGSQTRPHGDLDIGVLRRDVPGVVGSMPGWEFFEAQGGRLHRLQHSAPRPEVRSLWSRLAGEKAWALELMLDESQDESWVFRRDPRFRRPLDSLTAHTAAGIPYLVPEIQLLYKANRLRPQDDADFGRVAPYLGPHARAWLREALQRLDARHEWLGALES